MFIKKLVEKKINQFLAHGDFRMTLKLERKTIFQQSYDFF